jgi:hypothetical protein
LDLDLVSASRWEHGLSGNEAAQRLCQYGPNATADVDTPAWRVLLGKFIAPGPCLLEAAIVLQLVLHEYIEASVIGVLLVFNAALGFFQEGRAKATLAALKPRLAVNASVLRDGVWSVVPAANLVPGDVVRLTLGSVVAADVRIAEGAVQLGLEDSEPADPMGNDRAVRDRHQPGHGLAANPGRSMARQSDRAIVRSQSASAARRSGEHGTFLVIVHLGFASATALVSSLIPIALRPCVPDSPNPGLPAWIGVPSAAVCFHRSRAFPSATADQRRRP